MRGTPVSVADTNRQPMSRSPHHVTPGRVKPLPIEWIQQLHHAAILGKDEQILQLIAQIPSTHARLAQALRHLINDFNFVVS